MLPTQVSIMFLSGTDLSLLRVCYFYGPKGGQYIWAAFGQTAGIMCDPSTVSQNMLCARDCSSKLEGNVDSAFGGTWLIFHIFAGLSIDAN